MKVNFLAKYIGFGFLLLAFLSLFQSLIQINTVYITCLAISGLLFVLSDFIEFQQNYIKLILERNYLRKEYNGLLRQLDNEEISNLDLPYKFRKPFDTIKLPSITKFLFKDHGSLFIKLLYFLSISFILVVPHIYYIKELIENTALSSTINSFTIFFTLGITIYLIEKKNDFAQFKEKFYEEVPEIMKFKDKISIYQIKKEYQKEASSTAE